MPLGVGQTIRQGLKGLPASAYPSRQSNPLQHCCGWEKHVGRPQMRKHCLDYRLAAIGGPRGVGAHLQAGPPIGQAEAPKAQELLKFKQMLPTGLGPMGIVAEQEWIDPDLACDKREHRCRWGFRGIEYPARIPENAKLNGEAQAVTRAPLCSDENLILGAEHVVSGHLGWIDSNGKEAGTLLRRQQGAMGHDGLDLMAGDRS
jgi:hypothetical protein